MSQSQPFVGQTPLFGTGRHSDFQCGNGFQRSSKNSNSVGQTSTTRQVQMAGIVTSIFRVRIQIQFIFVANLS